MIMQTSADATGLSRATECGWLSTRAPLVAPP